ncbi:MAG TPA: DNA primase small subunit domain-containing protein [Propionibacteriaceae bacterium]|nr:DNA primase small subunit domain-containing protein [Propionibacteriaceae bacterium]
MVRDDAVELDAGGQAVRLSSPDKLYFPDLGITKRRLAEYILTVSEGMLAALYGRPTTMERWPGGVTPDAKISTRHDSHGDAFYQKKSPAHLPAFVETAEVTYPSGRRAHQVTPTNVATLVWMLNLGTLRWHPWPVTAPATDLVDELRIDLDPQPGTDFRDAARAAVELREVLRDAGLTGWPKTSGGRGVHVFCRIEPVDFVEARHAAISVGRELARRMPDQVTVSWWKEERGARVFVDFNQMARDRLMTSAYSIRPMPKAQVSAPLAWEELDAVDPSDFTVLTMPARYCEGGDRWARRYEEPRESIATALAWYERDAARGEGEMPYPPEYPKMPGEPPRVQPSRQRMSG